MEHPPAKFARHDTPLAVTHGGVGYPVAMESPLFMPVLQVEPSPTTGMTNIIPPLFQQQQPVVRRAEMPGAPPGPGVLAPPHFPIPMPMSTPPSGTKPGKQSAANDDGWQWRKYGEKLVKGSPCPRSYYKCSQPGCPAKKIVERDADSGDVLSTQYKDDHNHSMPVGPRQAPRPQRPLRPPGHLEHGLSNMPAHLLPHQIAGMPPLSPRKRRIAQQVVPAQQQPDPYPQQQHQQQQQKPVHYHQQQQQHQQQHHHHQQAWQQGGGSPGEPSSSGAGARAEARAAGVAGIHRQHPGQGGGRLGALRPGAGGSGGGSERAPQQQTHNSSSPVVSPMARFGLHLGAAGSLQRGKRDQAAPGAATEVGPLGKAAAGSGGGRDEDLGAESLEGAEGPGESEGCKGCAASDDEGGSQGGGGADESEEEEEQEEEEEEEEEGPPAPVPAPARRGGMGLARRRLAALDSVEQQGPGGAGTEARSGSGGPRGLKRCVSSAAAAAAAAQDDEAASARDARR